MIGRFKKPVRYGRQLAKFTEASKLTAFCTIQMADSPIRLSLSVKGLRLLEGSHHERDFTFIVGDERYSCPSFVAEFLSPRVTSLRSQDITIDEFSIETEDPGHHFGTLLSLAERG
jgi:hypothetical protein